MLRRGLFLGALAGAAASAVRLPTLPGIDRLIGGTQSPEDRLAWIEAELTRLGMPMHQAAMAVPFSSTALELEMSTYAQSPTVNALIKEGQSIRRNRSQNAFGGAQAVRGYLAQGIRQQASLGAKLAPSLLDGVRHAEKRRMSLTTR